MIERLELTGAADHEEEDDILRLGSEVWLPGCQWFAEVTRRYGRRTDCRLVREQAGQGDAAQAEFLEESAAVPADRSRSIGCVSEHVGTCSGLCGRGDIVQESGGDCPLFRGLDVRGHPQGVPLRHGPLWRGGDCPLHLCPLHLRTCEWSLLLINLQVNQIRSSTSTPSTPASAAKVRAEPVRTPLSICDR